MTWLRALGRLLAGRGWSASEARLRSEVRALRRMLRESRAESQRLLGDAVPEMRNWVPLSTHVAVANDLHRAEVRIAELEGRRLP